MEMKNEPTYTNHTVNILSKSPQSLFSCFTAIWTSWYLSAAVPKSPCLTTLEYFAVAIFHLVSSKFPNSCEDCCRSWFPLTNRFRVSFGEKNTALLRSNYVTQGQDKDMAVDISKHQKLVHAPYLWTNETSTCCYCNMSDNMIKRFYF